MEPLLGSGYICSKNRGEKAAWLKNVDNITLAIRGLRFYYLMPPIARVLRKDRVGEMTLSEAFEKYRADRIIFRNQSAKTEENHLVSLRALLNYFGDIQIETLTFEMVRKWKLHLEQKRSTETVRNYIIKLRVVLSYLRLLGLDVLDPERIPVPKRTDKIPQFINEGQVAQLIKATDKPRNKALISLLYSSGIRVAELCALDRDDIHKDTFTVVGKGGRARLCFVDLRTQLLLSQYLRARRDNHPALFLNRLESRRITPGNVQEVFRYARKNARLNVTVHPHTLRHSFATNLLRNNMNIRYVQMLLGHSSLETTQMYTHVVDEDLRKVYAQHHTV